MNKLATLTTMLVMLFAFTFTANAQAPYRHSIGATVGNMQAFCYKTFPTSNFAIQIDAGEKFTVGAGHTRGWGGWSSTFGTVGANVNFLYEPNATGGLYWFIGGGPSLGYWWSEVAHGHLYYVHGDWGKFGVNAMGGLEYKFNIPLALQFDFRPGYGLMFDGYDNTISYFDWSVNAGVRYTF
ncbi:MAG: hypothetical protein II757_05545 [Bacteroidales bacterium]|nr:hypothetical protein [Bacteroidales bacterium]MCR5115454.1 hypothetical protein [Bacteroidales bacterium]